MSLEEEINEKLVKDKKDIVRANLDRIEKILGIYEDGTIEISSSYKSIDEELKLLIYLIGQKYSYLAKIAEEDTLETKFFYDMFEMADRTIRRKLQKYRDKGFITKESKSKHKIISEKLLEIIDLIEGTIEEDDQ